MLQGTYERATKGDSSENLNASRDLRKGYERGFLSTLGNELGYVKYRVYTPAPHQYLGDVTLTFYNPAVPAVGNKCHTLETDAVGPHYGKIATSCSISKGMVALVNYCAWYNTPLPTLWKRSRSPMYTLLPPGRRYYHTINHTYRCRVREAPSSLFLKNRGAVILS